MENLKVWFQRYFSDPQVVFLSISLLAGFFLIKFASAMLAPFFASVVIAYLMESPVQFCERWHIPRPVSAVILVFTLLLVLIMGVFSLAPTLSDQLSQLLQQLPVMVEHGRALLMQLPENYPTLFSEEQITQFINSLGAEIGSWRQDILSRSLSFGVGLLTVLIYAVLLPVLVFLLIKDKQAIFEWIHIYLPDNRGLAQRVWKDVDGQVGNYVRGKFLEIIIIWLTSFTVFTFLDLNYAMLLALLIGLSVVIPYVGAAVVTIPVALVAYLQWGWSAEFGTVIAAYSVIQALDGYMLVPFLFSEVVNLHPIAIIVSILFFGGLWGFWGVFFAIPLATLVQAVLHAWPRASLPGHEPELSQEQEPNEVIKSADNVSI